MTTKVEQGCAGMQPVGAAADKPSVGNGSGDLTPSSKRHPCPICGRQKDGDCRIGTDLVLCHHGSSHHPPEGLRPGDTTTGSDGQEWAFTGDSSDGRTATYVLHKPRPDGATHQQQPTPLIELARLPKPGDTPPDHVPDGQRFTYSATQAVVVKVDGEGKKHRPHHLNARGREVIGAGPEPWPLWHQADAIEHGRQKWICEAEGEKCAQWFRAGGLVAVTQPGHNHKAEDIERRYRELAAAGVKGIAYLADNDKTGSDKGIKCRKAAAAAGLQFLLIHAADVWPGIGKGGSIDDAQGSAADRVAVVAEAIKRAALQEKARQSSDKGSSDEPEPPSYRELMAGALAAIRAGDEDTEMAIRAEIIGRFKRSDPQITAALFRLLTEQETGRAAGAQNSVEALDLDEIEGMDPLIDGAMPANDIGLVYATKGSGKTLKALAMSFAVIDGTGYLDHAKPAKAGSVLFIASDSGAAPLKAAMQELGVSDHPATRGPDRRFYVWAHDARQGMAAWSASINGCVQLLQFVKAKGIDLVVIDSAKTVCAKAGISYLDNDSVTALLTFIKETICVHASVLIVSHDGTEKGSHSGAKAWAEVPSIVHNIQQIPEAPQERLWRVVKNRMGPTRELRYTLGEDGRLEPVAGVEVIQDAAAAVLQVLTDAHGNGVTSLSRAALVQEIGQRFRLAPKTVDNTLSRMTRATKPEICRVSSPRGHYKLAPRIAASLPNNVPPFGKEQGQTPVTDRVLVSSRGVGSGNSLGTERVPASSQLPRVGNSTKPSQALDSPDVPSRKGEMPIGEVELVEVPGPFLRNTAEARIRELRPGTPDLASWSDEEVAGLLESLESAEQRRRSGLTIPEAA